MCFYNKHKGKYLVHQEDFKKEIFFSFQKSHNGTGLMNMCQPLVISVIYIYTLSGTSNIHVNIWCG